MCLSGKGKAPLGSVHRIYWPVSLSLFFFFHFVLFFTGSTGGNSLIHNVSHRQHWLERRNCNKEVMREKWQSAEVRQGGRWKCETDIGRQGEINMQGWRTLNQKE